VEPKATERPVATVPAAVEPPTRPLDQTEQSNALLEESERSRPAAGAGQLDAAALRRLWPEVLEVVKRSSRRTRALLDNAQIVDVSGELVSLSAPNALARMIAEDSNTSVLRAALTEVVGGEWKIAVSGGPGPGQSGNAAPPEPEPDPRDDSDDDRRPHDGAPAPDPEEEALRLLRDQLGARPLDE
jgi:DNA polymerase-3 subunit gamma/tau